MARELTKVIERRRAMGLESSPIGLACLLLNTPQGKREAEARE